MSDWATCAVLPIGRARWIHKVADGCYVRLYGDVSRIHNIMEEWAGDEATLGNCGHNHRCRLCDEGTWLPRACLSNCELDAETNDAKTVRVVHEDLCRVAKSVATMVHDLDNGKHKYVEIELSIMRDTMQKWVADKAVLGGGCHNHQCQKCVDIGRGRDHTSIVSRSTLGSISARSSPSAAMSTGRPSKSSK